MKTITIEKTIYQFSELSDEAKEHAHMQYLAHGYEYLSGVEARDTIEALASFFGVRCYDWEFGGNCPPSFSLDFGSSMLDALELKGNRARAYFAHNFWNVPYYGEKFPKVRKGRKVYRTMAEIWDNCPFTGVCFDCDGLQALHDFMTGKGDYSSRRIDMDERNTVESVIHDCFEGLFDTLQKDVEYSQSLEAFAELCEANEWEFDEDGVMQ